MASVSASSWDFDDLKAGRGPMRMRRSSSVITFYFEHRDMINIDLLTGRGGVRMPFHPSLKQVNAIRRFIENVGVTRYDVALSNGKGILRDKLKGTSREIPWNQQTLATITGEAALSPVYIEMNLPTKCVFNILRNFSWANCHEFDNWICLYADRKEQAKGASVVLEGERGAGGIPLTEAVGSAEEVRSSTEDYIPF